jgi:hypothetical protein
MALVTVSEIKTSYLNIGDSTQDTRILWFILQAGLIIKGICKQPIETETVALDFVGNRMQTYLLPYTVPVTLTSLQYKEHVDDATWTTATGAIVVKADGVYQVYYAEGLNYVLWRANLTVGYTDANTPADIKSVCSEMVVELFKNTDYSGRENRIGLQSVASSEGGTTVTTVYRDLTNRFRARLAPYIVRAWL